MATLPFTGRLFRYSGRNEQKRDLAARKTAMSARIARRANEMVANDPDELQQILFGELVNELGCSLELVRQTLSDGGSNGITFRVRPGDRERLQPFVRK
jgi:hypothetical protein